jgi:feruloyl-CoA synthase
VVINTHRMLCANQQMMAQTWRFLDDEKPVLVDWLPWSHTFGGNHNLHMVLSHGGALYIDEGRPAPGLIEKTLRNLREVRPTLLFNVPRGFDMLLPFLEADDALAAEVMSRLRLAFYAAAALAPSTWQRLEAVARRVRPAQPLWLTTSWGATETSPAITSAHWRLDGAGCIGAPLPGLELKFVPNGDKLEMRVKGVSVFPGYRNAPRETAEAFDDEGYYRIGDAGYLADPARPERGVMFHGRVAEDFKLASGTWVSVGTLRVELVSRLAPLVQDIVVTGHDRSEIGLLVFASPQAAARPREALHAALLRVMRALRDAGAGSSQCPARALVLGAPPDIDAGEITDKGYINQRAVLTRRAAEVERLHGDGHDPEVVRLA